MLQRLLSKKKSRQVYGLWKLLKKGKISQDTFDKAFDIDSVEIEESEKKWEIIRKILGEKKRQQTVDLRLACRQAAGENY